VEQEKRPAGHKSNRQRNESVAPDALLDEG
jgi:hypothetical protein